MPAPLPTIRAPLRARLVSPYVWLVAAVAGVVAVFADVDPVRERPGVLLLLVVALVALDLIESDLFGGGHVHPTTLPALMIALLFGPIGVLLGEGCITVSRLVRRRNLTKIVFDLAMGVLAGAAAWAVAQPLPGDGLALLLTGVAIGATYFAVNSLLLVGVWGLHEGGHPLATFRERMAPGALHETAYGPVAALLVLTVERAGPIALGLLALPIAAMWLGQLQTLAISRRRVTELPEANERLRRLMVATVESLARTIEARDPYTGGHTERVGKLAQDIASELGFGESDLRALAVGAVIHDIGKIGIPDAVLLKAGPLDEEEWAAMRRHPEIGSYILDELEIPGLAKAMARHHHERYDGTGYPDGVAGEDIPLAARVLSVADALDAMTSDRPYRRALPMDVALGELEAKAGTQFCPRVVAAALATVPAPPAT